jgi:hypothetical protein
MNASAKNLSPLTFFFIKILLCFKLPMSATISPEVEKDFVLLT